MIYLDSCIVIYLVEKHPNYYPTISQRLRQDAQQKFAISPLVILECLVGPLKLGDKKLEQRFESFFATVTSLDLNESIFRAAAQKRANSSTKTPDALHLATAEYYRCTHFWTNDERLIKAASQKLSIIKVV